jgi:HD-GYP domain-containing protein (c-di-GMP phosphodiesterase class II)
MMFLYLSIFSIIVIFILLYFFITQRLNHKKEIETILNAKMFLSVISKGYEKTLNSNLDIDDKLCRFLLNFCFKLFDAEYVFVEKKDNKTQIFQFFDFKIKKNLSIKYPLDNNIIKNKPQNKTIRIYKNNFVNNKEFPLLDRLDCTLIFLNLKIKKEIIATFEIYTKNINLNLVHILKLVIDSLVFYANMSMDYKNIKNMAIDTLKTLGKTIDVKSHYTKKHTERVTFYCKKILERMDFSKYDIEDVEKFKQEIEYAAILHDLGKVGIKDEILNKEDILNKEEWDIMTRHPLIGEQIIAPIKSFEYVPSAILYHHERFDGKGYPYGLKGNDIPLGARIISIVDSYDAMTTDRVYKRALTKDLAVDELKKYSGEQFDPDITAVFLGYLENEDDATI